MTAPAPSQNDNENALHKTEGKEETGITSTDMSPDEIAIEDFCITVAWIYLLSLSEESERGEDEEE